jgi:hypothetical protein
MVDWPIAMQILWARVNRNGHGAGRSGTVQTTAQPGTRTYVTMITDSNHQVFFAYREAVAQGQNIQIRGRVKRHADRATQLSRVKLIKQEAV